MRIQVLLALAALAAGRVRAEDARVGSIRFEGRRFIDEETLMARAGVRPGDAWRPESAAEIEKRLKAWPYLAAVGAARAEAGPDGAVGVTVPITERSVIGSVDFRGNDALKEEALLTASGLRKGQPLLEDSVAKAQAAVLAEYHKDGFLIASADPEVIEGAGGRADVVFHVTERRRVYVSAIELEGAVEMPASEALGVLELQPRRLFGLISRGYYAPERIEADLDRLRAHYVSRGFLRAEVGLDRIELDSKMTWLRVKLRVHEGPRFTVAQVEVRGHKLFPTRRLLEVARVETGVPVLRDAVEDGLRRIVRWYEERADIAPKITAKLEPLDGPRVAVVFELKEEEHYVVGQVTIEGNERTLDRVVRSDVTLEPGKHWTSIEVEKTLKKLEERGLYSDVEYSHEPGAGPNLRDVTLTVKEREHFGYFGVSGGGASNAGGFGYFNLHHSNLDLFRLPLAWNDWRGAFTGGGQTLDIEAVPGSRESEYRFRFIEPYFFRSDLALSLSGGPSIYDRRTYDEKRVGGAAELRKYFDRDHRFSLALAYLVEQVKIDDLDTNAPPDAVAVEGRTFLAYPRVEIRFDARELDYYSGTQGFLASARVDAADEVTGSELDFTRVVLAAEHSIGLFDWRPDFRHVLRARVELDWIEGNGGDEVPLFERFYLGGARSFPGFEYRRLGPHQGKTPVGGEAAVHGFVEYSFPLAWREVRPLARFEWGDIEPDISSLSAGRIRTAVGGGLQIRLKLAGQPMPANLYWMKALSSEAGDEEQLFSFTIGVGF